MAPAWWPRLRRVLSRDTVAAAVTAVATLIMTAATVALWNVSAALRDLEERRESIDLQVTSVRYNATDGTWGVGVLNTGYRSVGLVEVHVTMHGTGQERTFRSRPLQGSEGAIGSRVVDGGGWAWAHFRLGPNESPESPESPSWTSGEVTVIPALGEPAACSLTREEWRWLMDGQPVDCGADGKDALLGPDRDAPA